MARTSRAMTESLSLSVDDVLGPRAGLRTLAALGLGGDRPARVVGAVGHVLVAEGVAPVVLGRVLFTQVARIDRRLGFAEAGIGRLLLEGAGLDRAVGLGARFQVGVEGLGSPWVGGGLEAVRVALQVHLALAHAAALHARAVRLGLGRREGLFFVSHVRLL